MRFTESQVRKRIGRTILRQQAYYGTGLPIMSFLSGLVTGGCLGFVCCLIYGLTR